jgi:hypothetical protein
VRVLAPDGTARAAIDRRIGTAQPGNVQRIPRGLLDRNISGNDRDRPHAHIGSPQRHNQRDGIVGRSIGIDQEIAGHRTSVSNESIVLP